MGKAVQESRQLQKERIKRYCFLIKEYDQIKRHEHPNHRKVGDFYAHQGIDRRIFLKYYHRFKHGNGDNQALLPQKRGPRYKTRRSLPYIENKVIEQRLNGNNKYEISRSLKITLKNLTPSPSGVYNILKRHNLNKLNCKMKHEKRKIIKKKAGELGHIDAHYLKRGILTGGKNRVYMISLIDDCSRVM